jgi:hypothetical protein
MGGFLLQELQIWGKWHLKKWAAKGAAQIKGKITCQ